MDISIKKYVFGMHEMIQLNVNYNYKHLLLHYQLIEVKITTTKKKNYSYLFVYLEKHVLLACSKDDTLKLIELRENRVMQTFRLEF